jgi:uncharacterized membrane protein YccC
MFVNSGTVEGPARTTPPGRFDWRSPLRATLGGLCAFAVAGGLHLPEPAWAVLSALIVMRALPGNTMRAGRDRLLGTLCGAAIALAATPLRLVATPEPVLLALVLVAASGLAALRPNFRTAPIAAIIVVFAGAGVGAPLLAATLRVAEIGLGAACGLAVSWLVFKASRIARRGRPAAPAS